MRWQTYLHDEQTRKKIVKDLLNAGFTVYGWRNCNRFTFEKSGSGKHLTYFLMNTKHDVRVVKSDYPNPHESGLAYDAKRLFENTYRYD